MLVQLMCLCWYSINRNVNSIMGRSVNTRSGMLEVCWGCVEDMSANEQVVMVIASSFYLGC